MASFDIKSLFTNIPLYETIEIISNELLKDRDTQLTYTKKQFINLLDLAIKDYSFIFNNSLYVQVDGVAMGSCLGLTLANAFLCHHETKWLSDCPSECKPIIFIKDIFDDTFFILFKNSQHIPKFLSYLNTKHPNIEFTCETEINSSILFLDVIVSRNNNQLHTAVYRKPTFTGLGINYLSFIPAYLKLMQLKLFYIVAMPYPLTGFLLIVRSILLGLSSITMVFHKTSLITQYTSL